MVGLRAGGAGIGRHGCEGGGWRVCLVSRDNKTSKDAGMNYCLCEDQDNSMIITIYRVSGCSACADMYLVCSI